MTMRDAVHSPSLDDLTLKRRRNSHSRKHKRKICNLESYDTSTLHIKSLSDARSSKSKGEDDPDKKNRDPGGLVSPSPQLKTLSFFKDLDKNSSDGVDSDASKDNVKKVEDVNETKSIWTTATPNAVIKQRNKLDLLPKSDTKAKNKHKNIGASKGKEKCGSDDRGGAGNNGEGKVYNTEFSHKDKHGTVIHSISNRTSKNYSKLHEKERVSDSDQSQGNEENEEVVKEESEQEVIRQSEDDDKDSGSKNEEEDEHKPKMKEMTPAPQEHFISKEEDEKLSFSQVQCNNDIDSGKDANDTDVHRTDDTDKDGDTLICAVLIDLLSKVNNTVTRMYDETCGNGQLKSVSHFSPNLLEALMTMHDAQKQVLLAVTKLNDHVDDLMNTLKEAHQAASTVHETIAATF